MPQGNIRHATRKHLSYIKVTLDIPMVTVVIPQGNIGHTHGKTTEVIPQGNIGHTHGNSSHTSR